MCRKAVWFSCALLLCAGYVLSVDKVETPSGSKNPSHSPDQTSTNVDHATSSHSDSAIAVSKTSDTTGKPSAEENPPSSTEKPTQSSTTSSVLTSSSSHATPSTSHATPSSSPATPSSSHATPSSSFPPSSPSSTVIPVTPQPDSQKGSWNITVKNVTCLKIDGKFSISYTYSINKTNETDHIIVPKGAKATGDCGRIKLSWSPVQNVTNTVEFIFKKINNTQYVLESFDGYVYLNNLNKSQSFNTNNKDVHFETPLNQSYSCAAMRQITVDNHTKITLEEFHLQAFKVSNTTNFDASVDCAGSTQHTPDIVPIVVGCVLALLVIAVLVAYLISRRRSQTRGYLSM